MSDNISTSNSTTNLSTTDTICCCSIQNCQKCIQLEQENNSLKEENAEFKSKFEQLQKETEKLARFVLIPNKMTKIKETTTYTCCESKCINKYNLKYGSCITKNGYVNVREDGKTKYHLAKENGKNEWIVVIAQNSFKRADCYSQRYSLFYYEVKMIKQTDNDCYASIGFGNIAELFLCNTNASYGNQKLSWNDGDVFGCGVVFQPNKESFVIVFFTKNGNKIGNKIFLEEIDELCPKVGVRAVSVETNFGYDLAEKPFMYDVNKHFC